MTDPNGAERFEQSEQSEWAGRSGQVERPGDDGGGSVPVATVTAIDPVLRDSLTASLLLDVPGAVELRYAVDVDSGVLRRLVVDLAGVREDEEVELEHPCVSCAMREDAVPTLDRLSRDPRIGAILLVPPISADPQAVAGTLVHQEDRWRLAGSVAVLSGVRARHDLLGADTLAERGLQWAVDDRRSVGEALAAQIEYSGLIVVDGGGALAGAGDGAEVEGAAGLELVEHLRAPDQWLATSVHDLEAAAVLGLDLDHVGGLRRRDPRRIESYGGPTEHGTWTVDMHSDRPFHPRRFLENVEDLGAGRLRGRGRFWVPDRPRSICQWDGAGGQVSIGAVLETGADLPSTRMVVTGVEAADAVRVRDAFARSLLTPEEWAQGLAPWLGTEDLLAPWLGRRDAGRRHAA
ncbi:GTP-binding protein [Brachybacterium sp. AOP43-C2-M15]|uniref:GTP-binding protein n=1 Tax=Brachybacterium sp. AOP43-C2-M15 TaxID=3457661 RepID=UPI004034A85F